MLEMKTAPASETTELGPNTVRLTFLPGGQSVVFETGKLPYRGHGEPQSILDVAMNFVKKGEELLSACSEEEADRLDMAADLQLHSRLGCQAIIEKPGEVVVEIPSWNRNYISEGGGSKL